MSRTSSFVLIVFVVAGVFCGCATGPPKGRPAKLNEAKAPAWSFDGVDDGMVIAISPARRTLQIAGVSGTLVGAGVAAVANERYRRTLQDALDSFSPGRILRDRLAEWLEAATTQSLVQVDPPVASKVAYNSPEAAQKARYAQRARYAELGEDGHDMVLDLDSTYGLFGPGASLVVKLEGELRLVPEGTQLWNNDIVVRAGPVLACDTLTDPTKRLGPDFSSMRLTAEDNAVRSWAADGGKPLRNAFQISVDGTVAALLCDLGLVETAEGEYYLGVLAMNRKNFKQADRHFVKALELQPDMNRALNARAVNMAHNGQLEDAIKAAKALVNNSPGYGPALFNLAWWYAVEKNEPDAAEPFYEKALATGMAAHGKIDKALGR